MTTTDFKQWTKECNKFENWYKKLGGDASNPNSRQGAFLRIEPKQVTEKSIYKILANG